MGVKALVRTLCGPVGIEIYLCHLFNKKYGYAVIDILLAYIKKQNKKKIILDCPNNEISS